MRSGVILLSVWSFTIPDLLFLTSRAMVTWGHMDLLGYMAEARLPTVRGGIWTAFTISGHTVRSRAYHSHNGLATATAHPPTPTRVMGSLPPAMTRVIAMIRSLGRREPDHILPEVIGHRPHLAYHPSFFILCPEAGEAVAEMCADLEDAGCAVIVIHPEDDVATALATYSFWR